MKSTLIDRLFSRKFQEGVSKDSIQDYARLKKEDKENAWATLITYVLKFKRKELENNTVASGGFSEIKEHSKEIFLNSSSGSSQLKKYSQVAAIASVLLLFAIGGFLIGESNLFTSGVSQSEYIEIKTPKGQQSEISLPDGTFVALNYDTRLHYKIDQNKRLQEVKLEGEAFFKVNKNKKRTFKVKTSDMNINVLGTEFNVNAHKTNKNIETTLIEGSILIDNILGHKEPVLLKPGQKWQLNKSNRKMNVEEVNTKIATLWRNGEYYFEDITLEDLARTIERAYNKTIVFEDESLKNERYSGSFYSDETIDGLIEAINLTIPINVRKNNDEIWIDKR